MEKFKFVLGVLVCLLIVSVNSSSAQGNISMITASSIDLLDSQLERVTFDDSEMLEMDFDSRVYEDFGMYINPYSNSIKIKSSKNITYSKVQITNVETGETVHNSKFNFEDNEVDLASVDSGNYRVIMTDDNNNIHSEVISILKLK